MAPYKNVSQKSQVHENSYLWLSRTSMKSLSRDLVFPASPAPFFFFYSKSALDKRDPKVEPFIKFIDRWIMELWNLPYM